MSFFSNYIGGISYCGGNAQLVVLDVRKNALQLCYCSEFEKASDEPLWFLEPILHPQEKILHKVKSVSVAVDNASTFMHNFPTESALSREEMNEHLQWELTQFIPNYIEAEYVNDIHTLKTHAKEKILEVFVVAARRSLILNIQRSLGDRHCTLGIADTNHFAAGYALHVNYPEIKTKKIALVGVMNNRADLSILTNGRLMFYRFQYLESEANALDFLAPHVQGEEVQEIYFYGTVASSSLSNNARERFGINAALLNPFKHLDVRLSEEMLERCAGCEHLFTPAIGCAVRKQ